MRGASSTSRRNAYRRSPVTASRSVRQRLTAQATLLLFLFSGAAGPAGANGTSTALGSVVTSHGSGEFTANTDLLTEFTQLSPQAILDWQADIQQPAHHSLEFRQGEDFSILNLSPGERPSEFWGRVVCDATCIFVNRAGIHFRDGSFADVGRIVAAGGDLAKADFLAGQYRFDDLQGRVTNAGVLRGQRIDLLGRSVANFGHVETPDGSFLMAAGRTIQLRDHDSPIVIESDFASFDAGPAVENTGSVDAGSGQVRMVAGDMLAFAVRSSGSIRAGNIHIEGGEGGLVEVRGELDATDRGAADAEGTSQGGEIDVLGDYVSIQAGARLDASGEAGGGRIRVGGDRHGEGTVRTARGTFVHADAELRADATAQGDGGEIIVWGDETAQIYGTLSATGGPLGGFGGFAETSGKRWLDVTRAPDLRALGARPGESGGDWLIDPNNIDIVADACDPALPTCLDPGLSPDQLESPLFPFNGGPVVRPTADNSVIQAGLIAGALEQGVSVTLATDTIGQVQGDQEGNIRVLAAINPEAANASAGSFATLSLLASNDLTVDADIGVVADPDVTDPSAESNLVLDITLAAGDLTQSQQPVPEDAIPNTYVGNLEINTDIRSAGGIVTLSGAEINSASGTLIETDGGNLTATAFSGDVNLQGAIDTRTAARDAEGNEQVGGGVNFVAQAARVPNSGASPGESIVVGGGIVVGATIQTDGGAINMLSTGGDIDIQANLDTSLVEPLATPSPGGDIGLRAREATFEPLSEADTEAVTTGGRIALASNAAFLTDGGDVTLGPDLTGGAAGAREIVINGVIDTRGASDAVGGAVILETENESASVTIADITPGDGIATRIVTGGGRIQSTGNGTFSLLDAELDARSGPLVDPDLPPSDIGIFHSGAVEISESAGATTRLAADQAIQITPGLANGSGDITLVGAPEFIAEEILLQVGDGHGGTSTEAQIVLGQAQFHSHDGPGSAPLRFSFLQEANFTADPISSHIGNGDLTDLERYTLSASDGILTITDPATVSDADLELRLRAGSGLVVGGAFSADPDVLAVLDVEIEDALTVDTDLATNLSDAALQLNITAGTPSAEEDPSLLIQGSLSAGESIVLRAGRDGEGDLAFGTTDPITLAAPNLTLRAGDGDANGTARVRSDTLGQVLFENGSGGAVETFTLRQDAPIDDATVPDPARFVGGVAGVDYTLRSDGADGGITLGDNGAAGLAGTRLSLHARGAIDLAGITGSLSVQSLDIGGLGAFTYTQALNEKISFADAASSRLVVRAGMETLGNLSFGPDMTLRADEIRLVAGDGVGGNAGESASRIDLSPAGGAAPSFESLSGAPLTFVYRQDASIAQADLPDLTTHFGGNVPGRLAIRSDDGQITLNELPAITDPLAAPVLQASEQLILSAPVVNIARSDGEDLHLDDVLQGGPGPLGLQIRSEVVDLRANQDDSALADASVARVFPGSEVRLTAFDTDTSTEPGLTPAAIDFDTLPAESPLLISVDQDGDLITQDPLDSSNQNFIDPATQLGAAGNAALNQVVLTSWNGGIEITPDSVVGADLTLSLESRNFEPSTTRTIAFNGASFDLASLVAVNPFGWVVERAGAATDLEIRSEGFLQLRAGLLGEGDMDFAGNVILDANTLLLSAGDDPLLPLYPDAPASESRPVVNVRDAAGNAAVSLRLHDLDSSKASLLIRQQGSLLDSAALGSAELAEGESLIPLTSQISATDKDGAPTRLNQLQMDSIAGDIRIHEFVNFTNPGNPIPALDAHNVLLGAGLGLDTENTVRLEQNGGNSLDFLSGSTSSPYDSFTVFAPRIEFVTTGTGVIKAENNDLLLLGASAFDSQGNFFPTSPLALLFQQDADFDESAEDCTGGCLPNPVTQLGPSNASGIDYTIRTLGSITLADTLFDKLAFSRLTLDGAEITLRNGASAADFDLILASLTVGDASAPAQIFLDGPTSTPSDPQALGILTLGDQTYNGDVTVDGRVELAGDVVHLTSTVEAVDEPGDDASDELVIAVRGQALLDGNIGATSELELFRVNFDPTPQSNPADLATLGLGGDSSDPFILRADEIEILAGGDLIADFEFAHTERAPVASTIFKRSGDLLIEADRFSMGTGERLSVAGNLTLTSRTDAGNGRAVLGDLSALEILVDADVIEIQRRAAGQYVDAAGLVRPDGGVDYVANAIDFQGTIELSGTGDDPVFGIPDPQATPDWMLPFSTFQSRADGQTLTLADLVIPPNYSSLADLHPSGGSRDDPSTMFIESEHVPTPPAWVAAPWLPFNHASVEELGIDIQPMSPAEYMSQLRGATLIDDVGQGLTRWGRGPLPVSDARIEGTEAARAVALLNELLGPRYGRAQHVRAALQTALDRYLRTSGARRVVGFELRRFVKNRPSSLFAAYKALEDLDTLFAMHRGLGLTPGEYRPIQAGWLEAIRPEGISTRELAEAIQPSRYVRGSDVLDIFGE